MELRRGQEEAQGAQTAPGADSKHRDKSPWALQGDGQDATHQRKEKSVPALTWPTLQKSLSQAERWGISTNPLKCKSVKEA